MSVVSRKITWWRWATIVYCAFLFYQLYDVGMQTGAFVSGIKGGATREEVQAAVIKVCCGTVVFLVLHWLARECFSPIGRLLIAHKPKWSEVQYNSRVDRFASSIFKASYFILVTFYAFSTLRNTPYFPTQLGGSGAAVQVWDPSNEQQENLHVTFLYTLCGAYHLSELLWQIAMERQRPDFDEMLLHHITAVYLIVFSFLTSYLRIGALVLFVHNASDICVYMAKIFVDTKYKVATLTAYIGMLVTWGYLRLIVFPFVLIHTTLIEGLHAIPVDRQYGFIGFNSMLLVLAALHIYWFYLFLVMGWHFIVSAETKDMQANLSATSLEKEKKI